MVLFPTGICLLSDAMGAADSACNQPVLRLSAHWVRPGSSYRHLCAAGAFIRSWRSRHRVLVRRGAAARHSVPARHTFSTIEQESVCSRNFPHTLHRALDCHPERQDAIAACLRSDTYNVSNSLCWLVHGRFERELVVRPQAHRKNHRAPMVKLSASPARSRLRPAEIWSVK